MKNILLIVVVIPHLIFGQKDLKDLTKKGIDTSFYVPKGLMVGEMAPEINLISINGDTIKSTSLLKEKELVIIFYRGKWCPVCERYLSNLNDSLSFIKAHNAEVLVIGPETFENAEKIADNTHADFILLPDTTYEVLEKFDVMFNVTKGYVNKIKTFKLTDIAKNNNQDEAKLPIPATFIIGQDGKIKWRHFNYNYSVRATVREIIDHLN